MPDTPITEVMPGRQFLFIIGSPRSGTTYLQILLASQPEVATTVELTFFDRYVATWMKLWQREVEALEKHQWKHGLPFIWSEAEFHEMLREFLRRGYEKVMERRPDAKYILDKRPPYSLHVESIKKLLPNARFIHLLRDGRDVAASMMAAYKKAGFGAATIEEAAVAWRDFTLGARKAAQFCPDFLEVRYEDLITEGPKVLHHVAQFIGLPMDLEKAKAVCAEHEFEKLKATRKAADDRVQINAAHYRRGIAGGWREDFTAAECYRFDRIAGPLLRELGYAQDDWWALESKDRVMQPLRHALESRVPFLRRAARSAGAALLGPDLAGKVRDVIEGKPPGKSA